MRTSVCGPESTRLPHVNAPRKTGPGGCKDANETIDVSTSLPIATGNFAGHSNLTNTIYAELEFDILEITETHGWQGGPHGDLLRDTYGGSISTLVYGFEFWKMACLYLKQVAFFGSDLRRKGPSERLTLQVPWLVRRSADLLQ